MYKKTNYEAPEAEILEVRFEGNFMDSDYTLGGGGSYNGDKINDNGSY